MTNEQINRLVAEELGYRVEQNQFGFYQLKRGDDILSGEKSREDRAWGCVPDFCEDHNAVAEMRKAIDNRNDRLRFFNALTLILGQSTCDWEEFNATPRQQAEAFLKMRGKWREDNQTRISAPVCKHCLSDPCECCDADVSPDMGAK